MPDYHIITSEDSYSKHFDSVDDLFQDISLMSRDFIKSIDFIDAGDHFIYVNSKVYSAYEILNDPKLAAFAYECDQYDDMNCVSNADDLYVATQRGLILKFNKKFNKKNDYCVEIKSDYLKEEHFSTSF